MSYGTITIGRLALTEVRFRFAEDSSGPNRNLTIDGQESYPDAAGTMTWSRLAAVHDDILGLADTIQPVRFGHKSNLDGYYLVESTSSEFFRHGSQVGTVDWSANLNRVGAATQIDLESILAGALTRNSTIAPTGGERWHAPPIGHEMYFSGPTQPSTMTRSTIDGTITVYRGLATGVNPRWSCALADYEAGRCRFVDSGGHERSGTNFSEPASGWTLHNGIARVQLSNTANTVLSVGAWDSGAWVDKSWNLTAAATGLGRPSQATVLRNDPECVVVRALWPYVSGPGRVHADLILRRGSRFVELYVQSQYSATLKLVRTSTEAGTSGTGYVRATSNDGDGNRYIVGSALTFTADTTNGGISLAATTTLDAFLGVELAGSSAVTGDQAANLYAQYLGAPTETVRGVSR